MLVSAAESRVPSSDGRVVCGEGAVAAAGVFTETADLVDESLSLEASRFMPFASSVLRVDLRLASVCVSFAD